MFTVVLTVPKDATTRNEMNGSVPFSIFFTLELPVRLRSVDCMQGHVINHWGHIAQSLTHTQHTHTVMSNVMLFYTIKIPVFVYWMFACCFTDVFDLRRCCCCCCCFFFHSCLFRLFVVLKLRIRYYMVSSCYPSERFEGGCEWKWLDVYVDGEGAVWRCRDYAIRICKKCLLFIFFVKLCHSCYCCWLLFSFSIWSFS